MDRLPTSLPPLDLFRRRKNGRPFISGHRGARLEAPENTMPSFVRAREIGADLIEFDVQQTADGHLVVLHDWTVDRTTSGRGRLSDLTIDQVRRLDAGRWFAPVFAGISVPMLAEVLAWMHGRVYPILELKWESSSGLPSLVEPVAAALELAEMVDQTLILSFDHPALIAIKERLPGIRTCITYDGRLADTVGAARAARVDAVWPSCAFLVQDDIDKLHRAGLAVGCEGHTVTEALRLVEWGVEMVEMDDLASLVQRLSP